MGCCWWDAAGGMLMVVECWEEKCLYQDWTFSAFSDTVWYHRVHIKPIKAHQVIQKLLNQNLTSSESNQSSAAGSCDRKSFVSSMGSLLMTLIQFMF